MSASRQPREGRHGGGPSLSRFKPSTPPQPPPLSASPIIYDPRGKDGSLVVDGTQLSNISRDILDLHNEPRDLMTKKTLKDVSIIDSIFPPPSSISNGITRGYDDPTMGAGSGSSSSGWAYESKQRISDAEGGKALQRRYPWQIMYFDFNSITTLHSLHLCSNLRFLDLSNNNISLLPNKSFWRRLPNLQILELHNNSIDSLFALQDLSVLPNLLRLSVYNNQVASHPVYRHVVVNACSSLLVLDGYIVSDVELIEGSRREGKYKHLVPYEPRPRQSQGLRNTTTTLTSGGGSGSGSGSGGVMMSLLDTNPGQRQPSYRSIEEFNQEISWMKMRHSKCSAVILLQSVFRGLLVRKTLQIYHRAATCLQRAWRSRAKALEDARLMARAKNKRDEDVKKDKKEKIREMAKAESRTLHLVVTSPLAVNVFTQLVNKVELRLHCKADSPVDAGLVLLSTPNAADEYPCVIKSKLRRVSQGVGGGGGVSGGNEGFGSGDLLLDSHRSSANSNSSNNPSLVDDDDDKEVTKLMLSGKSAAAYRLRMSRRERDAIKARRSSSFISIRPGMPIPTASPIDYTRGIKHIKRRGVSVPSIHLLKQEVIAAVNRSCMMSGTYEYGSLPISTLNQPSINNNISNNNNNNNNDCTSQHLLHSTHVNDYVQKMSGSNTTDIITTKRNEIKKYNEEGKASLGNNMGVMIDNNNNNNINNNNDGNSSTAFGFGLPHSPNPTLPLSNLHMSTMHHHHHHHHHHHLPTMLRPQADLENERAWMGEGDMYSSINMVGRSAQSSSSISSSSSTLSSSSSSSTSTSPLPSSPSSTTLASSSSSSSLLTSSSPIPFSLSSHTHPYTTPSTSSHSPRQGMAHLTGSLHGGNIPLPRSLTLDPRLYIQRRTANRWAAFARAYLRPDEPLYVFRNRLEAAAHEPPRARLLRFTSPNYRFHEVLVRTIYRFNIEIVGQEGKTQQSSSSSSSSTSSSTDTALSLYSDAQSSLSKQLIVYPHMTIKQMAAIVCIQTHIRSFLVRKKMRPTLAQMVAHRRATVCLVRWFKTRLLRHRLDMLTGLKYYINSIDEPTLYMRGDAYQLLRCAPNPFVKSHLFPEHSVIFDVTVGISNDNNNNNENENNNNNPLLSSLSSSSQYSSLPPNIKAFIDPYSPFALTDARDLSSSLLSSHHRKTKQSVTSQVSVITHPAAKYRAYPMPIWLTLTCAGRTPLVIQGPSINDLMNEDDNDGDVNDLNDEQKKNLIEINDNNNNDQQGDGEEGEDRGHDPDRQDSNNTTNNNTPTSNNTGNNGLPRLPSSTISDTAEEVLPTEEDNPDQWQGKSMAARQRATQRDHAYKAAAIATLQGDTHLTTLTPDQRKSIQPWRLSVRERLLNVLSLGVKTELVRDISAGLPFDFDGPGSSGTRDGMGTHGQTGLNNRRNIANYFVKFTFPSLEEARLRAAIICIYTWDPRFKQNILPLMTNNHVTRILSARHMVAESAKQSIMAQLGLESSSSSSPSNSTNQGNPFSLIHSPSSLLRRATVNSMAALSYESGRKLYRLQDKTKLINIGASTSNHLPPLVLRPDVTGTQERLTMYQMYWIEREGAGQVTLYPHDMIELGNFNNNKNINNNNTYDSSSHPSTTAKGTTNKLSATSNVTMSHTTTRGGKMGMTMAGNTTHRLPTLGSLGIKTPATLSSSSSSSLSSTTTATTSTTTASNTSTTSTSNNSKVVDSVPLLPSRISPSLYIADTKALAQAASSSSSSSSSSSTVGGVFGSPSSSTSPPNPSIIDPLQERMKGSLKSHTALFGSDTATPMALIGLPPHLSSGNDDILDKTASDEKREWVLAHKAMTSQLLLSQKAKKSQMLNELRERARIMNRTHLAKTAYNTARKELLNGLRMQEATIEKQELEARRKVDQDELHEKVREIKKKAGKAQEENRAKLDNDYVMLRREYKEGKQTTEWLKQEAEKKQAMARIELADRRRMEVHAKGRRQAERESTARFIAQQHRIVRFLRSSMLEREREKARLETAKAVQETIEQNKILKDFAAEISRENKMKLRQAALTQQLEIQANIEVRNRKHQERLEAIKAHKLHKKQIQEFAMTSAELIATMPIDHLIGQVSNTTSMLNNSNNINNNNNNSLVNVPTTTPRGPITSRSHTSTVPSSGNASSSSSGSGGSTSTNTDVMSSVYSMLPGVTRVGHIYDDAYLEAQVDALADLAMQVKERFEFVTARPTTPGGKGGIGGGRRGSVVGGGSSSSSKGSTGSSGTERRGSVSAGGIGQGYETERRGSLTGLTTRPLGGNVNTNSNNNNNNNSGSTNTGGFTLPSIHRPASGRV